LLVACLVLAALACAIGPRPAAASPDVVIADFESASYGDWTVAGTAFGAGPAKGTLPNQQSVTGYRGAGLVDSYNNGDDTTGQLTSPQFQIVRHYINFLVGGGNRPDDEYIALLVNGQIVRKTTGVNDEGLVSKTWDVSEFASKPAQIEIVDSGTGSWGHINVDDIIESDTAGGPIVTIDKAPMPAERALLLTKRYLHFPISEEAPVRLVHFVVNGKIVRWDNIRLADNGIGDYWAFQDFSEFKGSTVDIQVDRLPLGSLALSAVSQDNAIKGASAFYHEAKRPIYHFTSKVGWLNDPNGLVYYQGEYHLFYQHNPFDTQSANKHWGHAVSTDLVHWVELPDAFYPFNDGKSDCEIWSGSAAVDQTNSAGFQQGREKTLLAMFTAAGTPFSQYLSYSTDRGRTWKSYVGNPVVPNIAPGDRDPKIVWDKARNQWILALYLSGNNYALFRSPDSKQWTPLTESLHIGNESECPDFFPINLDGDSNQQKWVFTSASGHYKVGDFDGQTFTAPGPDLQVEYGRDYAVQTYSDIPASDGRRVQIGWLGGSFPGMSFNQQLSFPCVLTLRSTPNGPRLYKYPASEIEKLYGKSFSCSNLALSAGKHTLPGLSGDALDISAEIDPGTSSVTAFTFRGATLAYDAANNRLIGPSGSAPLVPINGHVTLRILVDRSSIEAFGNDGQVAVSSTFEPTAGAPDVELSCQGGSATVVKLTAHNIKSAL
jgi:fructan beta-fructosidase